MTTASPKFVARTDRPVDALLLDILRRVDAVARDLGIEYFVGGALARDLILLHVFGKDTGRATRDVDLGIRIDDWTRLDALRTHPENASDRKRTFCRAVRRCPPFALPTLRESPRHPSRSAAIRRG